jgi:hypothetical protein
MQDRANGQNLTRQVQNLASFKKVSDAHDSGGCGDDKGGTGYISDNGWAEGNGSERGDRAFLRHFTGAVTKLQNHGRERPYWPPDLSVSFSPLPAEKECGFAGRAAHRIDENTVGGVTTLTVTIALQQVSKVASAMGRRFNNPYTVMEAQAKILNPI